MLFNVTESSHLLSYNEPDHTEQSNVSVSVAIEEWPKHLQTGKRLGSPATTDFNWLYNFMSECRKRNYRVDYVAIHAYWGGRGSSVVCSTIDDWYKKLKEIHEKTGCPIWITEWNNGANWTHEGWPDTKPEQQEKQRKFIEDILAMMDTCSFIERYSIYNWVEEKRAMFWNNLNLTPAGKVYANFNAAQAFSRSKEIIPSWSFRDNPVLSYAFNEQENVFELSWTDINCEQVDEYVVVVYRVRSIVDGKEKGVSNEVQYGSILTDADAPVIGKIITPEEIRLYAYTDQYEEAPVTILGTQTYRMKTPMLPAIKTSSKSTCEIGVSMWNYNAGQTFVSQDTLSYMSDYSLYAYEEEIRQGYLTTKNGCRIGICGKVVLEGGRIKTIHHISSLNIRFPHEIKGCSEKLLPYIIEGDKVHNTLIISPPMCGKTTILRDLIRQISNGAYALAGKALGKTVGVVDERGEICACHLGVPQNDIGIKTDVLDGCPKVEGMMMLVRTMAPEVIAVDEIGSEEELQTMRYSMNCGCSILATAHGASIEELFKKKVFLRGREEGLFSRYIVLSRRQGAGTIEGVFDGKGNCIKILQNGGRI